MAFFMLFNVPKETKYDEMKKELSNFGDINFFRLTDDQKKPNVKFGQLDYTHISKNEDLINYLQSKQIEFKEKESRKQQQRNNKPTNKLSQNSKEEKANIQNPAFCFYKDKVYGQGIEDFQLRNNYEKLFTIHGTKSFDLTTTYPGLLVGSGYAHPKLKENDDDFQLGFFFDHTTGLPIISGSSIKGVLKNVAKHEDFMQDIYGQTIPLDIFEDGETVFYDAFILSSSNKNNEIFGSDYITSHHSDEPNGVLKDPNPIKFLKILPNVTFRFQFQCDDKYLDIFKKIIIDLGLGAKTNVGYGKFTQKVD